jgi:hypothetical protein
MPVSARAGLALVWLALVAPARAVDPWAQPGDLALRDDLQILADAGMLGSPLTTWPIPWASIEAELNAGSRDSSVPASAEAALRRTRARLDAVKESTGIELETTAAANSSQRWFRTFENKPREQAELTAAASWLGERFAGRLQGTYASDPDDDKEWRLDGSYVAVVLGNHILSGGKIDRWWGPGWDGGLIFSTNSRPVPALSLERNRALAFESKWLRWIGPWSYSLVYGRLDDDRVVNDANLLGFRVTFRPLQKLEIGLTRTAQWCGDGRPCDLDSLWDLIKGDDNQGSEGIDLDNEPGNQLAGIDLRWASPLGDLPYALYTQWVAEDEASGTPSRWIAQFGTEVWGQLDWGWLNGNYRLHVEYADTATSFYKDTIKFDVAYEHYIYQTGYRYRGRSIGHAMDNDGQMMTIGAVLVEPDGATWNAAIRWARVNRGGLIPNRNTVSQDEHDVRLFELTRRQQLLVFGRDYGTLMAGAGYYYSENKTIGGDDDSVRGFLQWTWDF